MNKAHQRLALFLLFITTLSGHLWSVELGQRFNRSGFFNNPESILPANRTYPNCNPDTIAKVAAGVFSIGTICGGTDFLSTGKIETVPWTAALIVATLSQDPIKSRICKPSEEFLKGRVDILSRQLLSNQDQLSPEDIMEIHDLWFEMTSRMQRRSWSNNEDMHVSYRIITEMRRAIQP